MSLENVASFCNGCIGCRHTVDTRIAGIELVYHGMHYNAIVIFINSSAINFIVVVINVAFIQQFDVIMTNIFNAASFYLPIKLLPPHILKDVRCNIAVRNEYCCS